MQTIVQQLATEPDEHGGRIIELATPMYAPRPEWSGGGYGHIPRPPQRQPSPADRHYDRAEAALAEFERGGDWRVGPAALVHAVLSIDIREAGHQ